MKTLMLMVLAHMVADYTLQGWLADGKQISWWRKQVPDLEKTMYRKDWLMAIFCHALYWSIAVALPLFFQADGLRLSIAVAANTVVHMAVDHLKCNELKISLVTDQLLHFLQIALTWYLVLNV